MLRTACFLLFVPYLNAADITLKPGNLAAVLEQARKAPKPVRIIVEDGVQRKRPRSRIRPLPTLKIFVIQGGKCCTV